MKHVAASRKSAAQTKSPVKGANREAARSANQSSTKYTIPLPARMLLSRQDLEDIEKTLQEASRRGFQILPDVSSHGDYTVLRTLGDQILDLQSRLIDFQLQNFPDQTLEGKIHHLIKEAHELLDDPNSDAELADCYLLIHAIAWKRGRTPWDLVRIAADKMSINEKRQWAAQPDANGVHHHLEP